MSALWQQLGPLWVPGKSAGIGPKVYRYVKWLVTRKKTADINVIVQYSEFALLLGGSAISYTGIVNPTAATDADNALFTTGHHSGGETPFQAIDKNVGTKFCLQFCHYPTGSSDTRDVYCSLILDAGSGNAFTFDGYTFSTANDSPDRDPSGWTLYGSNDGSTWTTLDTQSGIVCTNTRNVATGLIFSIS
jgi:hypothetical protein